MQFNFLNLALPIRIIMNKSNLILFSLCLFSLQACAQFNWSTVKKNAKKEADKILQQNVPLTNDEIIKGLKEALTIGSQNSSKLASKTDAYYKNAQLFIPFPKEAQVVEQKLREIGLGSKVDQFILTLNRAAEEAAKEAAPIFVSAVKSMTIKDGLNILNGTNDAATKYLKTSTSNQLANKFNPVISRALDNVSATKYWKDIINTYNLIPGVTKQNPDLAGYTTEKAINGLFILVAKEELKIRQDPAARVTDILKKVFGRKK